MPRLLVIMKYPLFGLCLIFIGISACRRKSETEPIHAETISENKYLDLRLMSFNVRYENNEDRGSRSWRQRIIGAVRMIRREKPDIIGVQEALHGQAADLWASLPGYEFFGAGRDDGRRAGEYSGIFYQRNRFTPDPSDGGTFWLSDTPEQPGSQTWGNKIPRVATWLRLVDRATGRGFYIFNTHWDHENQLSRERAALLIADRIDARRQKNEPAVLIGDFNSVESNPGYIYLTGKPINLAGSQHSWDHGLLDTYQALHPDEKNRRTLHFWTNNRQGSVKVDHILVSPGARVGQADIVSRDKPMVSDHFPVTAHVMFPATKKPLD